MMWSALLSTALLATQANALIRFPCSQLVTERFDPLVTPGQVSPHLHQIIGGNAFNLSMDVNNDLPTLSTCTTCRFKEDLSNYWTAVMFFKHQNGSLIRVPQFANVGTGAPNGGMTVYYIQPPGSTFQVFKKGFRMIVGNPMIRNISWPTDPNGAEAWSTSFRCFGANFGQSDGSANSPPAAGRFDTQDLPKGKCSGGIRAQIFFPSCWDGKTLDPPDHRSHMAFPLGQPPKDQGQILWSGGKCPTTHPVRTPLLFYETMWDTAKFANMWPADGKQPFIYSMGDPTGFGQHGDYVFGWKGDALDRAMAQCTDINGVPTTCKTLATLTDAEINSCVQKAAVNEVTEGYLNALPGCNPVQLGPGPATAVQNCNAVSTTGTAPVGTPNPTPTPTPSPTPTPGPTIPKYGQCGGNGWTGGTTCEAGTSCVKANDWFSQCM